MADFKVAFPQPSPSELAHALHALQLRSGAAEVASPYALPPSPNSALASGLDSPVFGVDGGGLPSACPSALDQLLSQLALQAQRPGPPSGAQMSVEQLLPLLGLGGGGLAGGEAAELLALQAALQLQSGASSPGPGTPRTGPSNNPLYKTELCRSWEEFACCRYGAKCQFAHGREELREIQRHPKYKTEVCRTFAVTGTCPYGTRCRFIHQSRALAQLKAGGYAGGGGGGFPQLNQLNGLALHRSYGSSSALDLAAAAAAAAQEPASPRPSPRAPLSAPPSPLGALRNGVTAASFLGGVGVAPAAPAPRHALPPPPTAPPPGGPAPGSSAPCASLPAPLRCAQPFAGGLAPIGLGVQPPPPPGPPPPGPLASAPATPTGAGAAAVRRCVSDNALGAGGTPTAGGSAKRLPIFARLSEEAGCA